jgi:conjugal transfer pilus assembly protein TraD
LANFTRGTELASRIASLISTSSGGDVFKDFSQMALNNIIQGLLIYDEKPTLASLRRYIEGGVQNVVVKAVKSYCEKVAPEHVGPLEALIDPIRKQDVAAKKASEYYVQNIQELHPSSDLEGLLTMFAHDQQHFSKMVASLLPILNMLTSGTMGGLLSPDREDREDTRDIYDTKKMIEKNSVVYIGLDSLTDAMIGSAIGSIVLADLAAVAGDRYNYGTELNPVAIYVDECAEVINDPFIQILNKGRGAKLRLTIATQTIADFAARLGSKDKAVQVLGNINNTITLRVIDTETQQYIVENLPKTRVKVIEAGQGMSSNGENPVLFGGNHSEKLKEAEADIFPPAMLGVLPNLEFIAKISGKLYKGRLPILGLPH